MIPRSKVVSRSQIQGQAEQVKKEDPTKSVKTFRLFSSSLF